MKRSADELDAENSVQDEKKKCPGKKLCLPFCVDDCPYKGSHNELILSLVNLKDSEWKTHINEAWKESPDLNQPLKDPLFCYPLLHWAAMLGKDKAVKWLLEQELCSLSNTSNKTVLFSMVRFLHVGVVSRNISVIVSIFLKLLDVFVKHDPNVLLVQEDNGTVLHLCARREEDSTSPFTIAPFFKYLKGILGKLEEYSKKKDIRLPLNKILETRNGDGDLFLHLLARRKDERKEARDIINKAEDKFPTQCLGEMKNNDGKTAEEIWDEFRPDPEVFQTSSQEIHVPFLSEASCSDGERPMKDLGRQKQEIASHGTFGSSGDQGCPGGSEEDIGVERLRQGLSASNRTTGLHHEVQSDGGREDNEGDEPREEIPPRLSKGPFSEKIGYPLTPLQSVVEGIEGQHVLQTEGPDEGQESDLHPRSNTDTPSGTLNVVKKLIHDTELKEEKLEQEKKILKECEDKVREQRAVVQALEEQVKANKNELHDCKDALSILK